MMKRYPSQSGIPQVHRYDYYLYCLLMIFYLYFAFKVTVESFLDAEQLLFRTTVHMSHSQHTYSASHAFVSVCDIQSSFLQAYDSVRPLSYNEADIFMLCFSVAGNQFNGYFLWM